jgi:zinc protease
MQRTILQLTTACALALTAVQAPRAQSKANDAIKIPFEVYTLPNGLTSILSVDRATPTVTVAVWYHVGSKNEQPGRTGFAHLFEHVMFTGSGHAKYGEHDRLTNGVGGNNNGTTDNDRTFYYETVPSNYLESSLWLEADRMGFLLDTLDLAKLNAQRDIVKNERRQSVDNVPYGRAGEIISEALYPKGHPYSWDVIGSMSDLSAASEEDVKSFFRLYYAPNNAFLTIVGDFDPAQAKAWIKKYFADLPKGAAIVRPKVAPVTLRSERRLVYEDRVPLPRLYVTWPTVGAKDGDDAALSILGAILSGSRTARLTKALVYDETVATQASTRQNSNEDGGEFSLTLSPRPGYALNDLLAAADSIVDKLKTEGPTADELQKATARQELAFLNGVQSSLGKAGQLATGAGYFGDPGHFKKDYEAALAVSAADVKRVANKYLTKGRVVLSVVPRGKTDLAVKESEVVK